MTQDDFIWHNCAGECDCTECQEYRKQIEGAKNTEQQVQPDIGDAPAILDNTVELDGVLYRV